MTSSAIAISFILALSVSLAIFGQQKKPPRPETARDAVCGLMVEKNPELSANYQGTTYYFCSRADRDKFQKNPQNYAKEK